MDITCQNAIGIVKDRLCLVCENDFDFASDGLDDVGIISNVVNAGELVFVLSEKLTIFCESKYVGIRVDSGGFDFIKAYHLVTDFIGRIA